MSLKARLLLAFTLISIIPVMAAIWFGYYNSAGIIKKNEEEAAHNNVYQTGIALDVWMESYEDILYQIYTNDDIVDMIDTINRNDADFTVTSGQLRRTLRGLFYAKEHIQSITIITESGKVIFYDMLTGSTTKNSWLETLGIPQNELYETISRDNSSHLFSTRYAGTYANERYYLFHLGHRIIDYKELERRLGIVLVSIDERLLQDICGYDGETGEYTFLVDNEGFLVSFSNRELLGERVIEWTEKEADRRLQYLDFIRQQKPIEQQFSLYSMYHEEFGYDIIHISNQEHMIGAMEKQRNIMFFIAVFSTLLLILIIAILTSKLTGSLQMLVGKMKRVETGELSVRVMSSKAMLPEVNTIASSFNQMLDKMEELMEREKTALEKQKNAEIEMLEAQINPHFLYNTLDMINWIAIDKDEYEISNAVMSLAMILRYGIDQSNSIVTINQECDWLRQYLFLQQLRMKNQFTYKIEIHPEIQECKVHKLLLQPFVENSIRHGFEGRQGLNELCISIQPESDNLLIEIYDNGKGIMNDTVSEMNRGIFSKSTEKDHIGMQNAFNRIHIYYSRQARVWIESVVNQYTKVFLSIPMEPIK